MALALVHLWAPFVAGLLAGCWIGGLVACAGVLLLMGRRVRHLEAMNGHLRSRLKARVRSLRALNPGLGRTLVMPLPLATRKTQSEKDRIASVN